MAVAGDISEGVDRPPLRIILIGKSGVGKSASGNTILNANLFPSACDFSSITKTCQRETDLVENWRVVVVDTPDFFFSTYGDKLSSEIERSVDLASPGVHAFLYVIPVSTFTEQEADVVSLCEYGFGEEAMRHTLVLFTHGDQLEGMTIETLIEQNSTLMNLVNECGGRYHVLNNKEPSDRDQVVKLLEKIDRMIMENDSSCYTMDMLWEAERRAKEEQERIIEEQHREEERERRKHQRDLERVKREAEERVQKEMDEIMNKEMARMRAEKESLIREMEEMERNNKEEEMKKMAEKSKRERQENKKRWTELLKGILQLKPKHLCAICTFVIVVMGSSHVRNKGSVDIKTFTQGCFPGILALLGGVVIQSVNFRALLRGKAVIPAPHSQRTPLMRGQSCGKLLCGFIAGAAVGYFAGTGRGIHMALGGTLGTCGVLIKF